MASSSRLAAASAASVVSGGGGIAHHHSSSPLPLPPRQQRAASTSAPQQNLLRRPLLEAPRAAKSSSSTAAAPKGFGAKKKSPTTTEKGTTPTPPWLADSSVCPCCSGRKFNACCAPFLSGSALPQTAEQLMRSRFAAYVTRNAEYIIRTTHPLNRAAAGSKGADGAVVSTLAQDVAATIKRVSWQRLKVEGTEKGGSDDDEGYVTFTTWFKVTGQVGSRQDGGDAVGTMSERSLFVRVDDDGDGEEEESEGEGKGEEGGKSKKRRGRWSYREGTPVINGVPRVLS